MPTKTIIPSADSKKATFDLVYEETAKQTYFHIRRMVLSHDDANDILQNTFLKVWRHMDKFKGQSQWSTWIYRIATNESIDFLNRSNRIMGVPLDKLEGELQGKLQSDTWFDGDEAEAKLQTAIAKLPAKQKQVFIMKYYDHLSYDEISKITQTSVGALKASYHHANNKLKESLGLLNL